METPNTKVKNYFRENGIKLRTVTAQLGMTPGAISNVLNGRQGFSKNMAQKLNKIYGFSIPYLLLGMGTLFEFSNERTDAAKNYHVRVSARCHIDTNVKATSEAAAVEKVTRQLKSGNGVTVEEDTIVANII